MIPFEVVYGKKKPSVLSYLLDVSKVQEVDKSLTVRADILLTLKDNLVMDHNRMKKQDDQCRFKLHFDKGDHVFLHLQPYKENSLKEDH
jgi:hypothetical protein